MNVLFLKFAQKFNREKTKKQHKRKFASCCFVFLGSFAIFRRLQIHSPVVADVGLLSGDERLNEADELDDF